MLSGRHQTAIEMREAGATFQAIGDVFDVTAARASAIYQRALILRTEQEIGLSTRTIGIVRNLRPKLEKLASNLPEDRHAVLRELLREPHCGRQQAEEIIAWLKAGNRELP
jgi:putative ubiquitin-RnfH superfamily antitoxin RatB of RatAB toxin-antitoxin module